MTLNTKFSTAKIIFFNLTYPIVRHVRGHLFRRFYLRFFLNHIGKNTYIGLNVDIRCPQNVYIGDNCVINKNVVLDGRGGLTLGNNVDVAMETHLWTAQHDYNDDYHGFITAPVEIEDYVWISSRVSILPGVTMHKGAVAACGAVVSKDVPAKTLVGGIPAKVIGERKSALLYKLSFKPNWKNTI